MRPWLLVLALLGAADARPVKHRKPIAFWIAGSVRGETRNDAIRRCERKGEGTWCRDHVIEVRGPYHRTNPGDDPDDDPHVFVYRGNDGTWYDRHGDFPGCDRSGCP